ncbi:hypothetical protein EIM44_04905 [Bibersteinia trehalosi]|uniref:Uncharacterized protein n=1 Tax=Bibersteinia trehalosi TaxID=47735 RepID=A0A3R8LEC0_BIBTR|nr:hypothetical protein [Bibersteinia trehalosi]RRN04780.1 hypothetical protein EIM44_04905 [Bibersteinia trehalosi]
MSYTANAKALQKQIAQMAKTDPVWLERIKAIKAKGVKGWNCIYQAVADFKLEKQATTNEKEQGLNRVELAFKRMGESEKSDLLHFARLIAAERKVKFEVKYFQPLREFSQDERACIATALARMQAVRQAFPPNLRVNEFHPKAQGTKKWLY